ncbi:MAG TPA: PAS domain-containing protein [Methanospirillum sp.]|nr:PAS domain-containing protein [Methanospirillum sp.]
MFCILLSIFLFSPISAAQGKDLPVYHYWADENYPPFEFKDSSGNAAGFSVDIIRAIGEEEGFTVNVTPHPWADVKGALTNNSIDFSGTMAYDINRTDRFVFSVPIITLNWYLYVLENSTFSSLDQLRGKRIILAKGDIWEEKLKGEKFPANITIASDYRQQLILMSAGGYDAAIINKPVALYLMKQEGITNLKPVGEPVDRLKLCIAAHVSNPAFIEMMNEGIIILNRNGKYESISSTWFAPQERQVETELIQKIFLYVLIPIIIFILIILFWIWTLRKMVASRTNDLQNELSARIAAQEAQLESEKRYALTLEAINDGLWDWNIKSGQTFYSPQYYRMAGYIPGEFPPDYQNWLMRIHPEDKNRIQEALDSCFSDGSDNYYVEFRFKRNDGSYQWMLGRGKVVEYDADTRPARMVGTHTDITQRKVMEEALQESIRSHKTLIDNLEGMVYRCLSDSDWTMEFLSDGVMLLTGYTPEELLYNRDISYGMIIHPEDREMVRRSVQEGIEHNNPYRFVYRIICKDGAIKWVWEQGQGIFRDTELVALEGYIFDITTETQDQESLKKMGYSIEHLNEGIIWFDELGAIFDANIAFLRLVSAAANQIRGSFVSSLPFRIQSITWEDLMQQSKMNGSDVCEAILIEGETERYLRVRVSYCEFGQEKVYCAIINDRTVEENSIRKVLSQKEELFEANEELLSNEEELRQNYEQLQQAQDALQLSEKKYRALFEDSIQGIFQADLDGTLLKINPAFAKIFGFDTLEEMRTTFNNTYGQIYASTDERDLISHILKQKDEIRGFESERQCRDGSPVWISMNIRIVLDDYGHALYYEGTIEDNTGRKKANYEKDIALRQVQKNFAELAILNDGIRNPLTVISIIAESLNPEENRHVINQVTRIDDLVTQLDKRWIESDKIIQYLKKHHDILYSRDECDSEEAAQ